MGVPRVNDAVNQTSVNALATELGLQPASVEAVLGLLKDGATVPFIARYRKEATGNLDEVQIRNIQEKHTYRVELDERRRAIVQSIHEQGKMTDELRAKLQAATTKSALEDLYAPYKPKKRTRGTMAKERGLEPLANRIIEQGAPGDPQAEAAAYVNEGKGVHSADEALQGARDIAAEAIADNADVRTLVRSAMIERGAVVSEAVKEKTQGPTKFEQYYTFRESFKDIPSHRYLAIRRGEREGVLKLKAELDAAPLIAQVHTMSKINPESPFAPHLVLAIQDAFDRLILPSIETDARLDTKIRSDREAVDVFAANLKNLLLAAPLGSRSVIGIDPGVRTGCKCAAVDMTGKFLENVTVYPTQKPEEAAAELVAFVKKHEPYAIAVGNGTAGRETEAFARKALLAAGMQQIVVVAVNEAGASVYSASDLARAEFPDLDLTIRGAISIARRLQDPLAELVKIDPKAIGVGQYQHDVHQPLLARKLDEVVESCVNHVGVELNTASSALLARVAGIGPSLAQKIILHREANGAFANRAALHEVSGLGPKAFEQAAGFLRVRESDNPLDASAVHPERYELIAKIASDLGVDVKALVGDSALAKNIDVEKYVGEGVGELTLRDIVSELQKPGRDPRESFSPPKFRDDVFTLDDLKPGMTFEGVVTNVTAFGAFVDIGVHQDGLVHVSQLSNGFVKNPADVVKAGDKLQVRLMEVDVARKRISLTAKSEQPQRGRRNDGQPQQARGEGGGDRGGGRGPRNDQRGGDRNRGGRGNGGGEQRAHGGGGHQGNRGGDEQRGHGGGGGRGGNDRNRGRNDQGGGGGNRDNRPQRPDAPRFSNNPFANLKLR